jgi:hypothetical protein
MNTLEIEPDKKSVEFKLKYFIQSTKSRFDTNKMVVTYYICKNYAINAFRLLKYFLRRIKLDNIVVFHKLGACVVQWYHVSGPTPQLEL